MIIGFIGAPGSGKSTQIQYVKEKLLKNADVIMLRVPNLVKKKEEILPYLTEEEIKLCEQLAKQSDTCRHLGKLSPLALDDILFNVAERCSKDGKIVLMDGAPRGLEQAQIYSSRKNLMDETVIVHLTFHENPLEYSVSRQFYREMVSSGIDVATGKLERLVNKFETYRTTTQEGLNHLKGFELPIKEIDANLAKETVSDQLKDFVLKTMKVNVS